MRQPEDLRFTNAEKCESSMRITYVKFASVLQRLECNNRVVTYLILVGNVI
jgi:hypothetical protein